MGNPLVSCLCVTENRPEFMPWLLWGYERQTYAERELVIIDSSAEPVVSSRNDVRVIAVRPGTNVPTKRNQALGAARGSIVAWFDDDDWQHPERLTRVVEAIQAGRAVAGASRAWFLDVFTGRCQAYDGRKALIFNGAGFSTQVARGVSFDEKTHRASDTVWLRGIKQAVPGGPALLDPLILTAWLCHDHNLSNPRGRRRFQAPLETLRSAVGSAWGDTEERLEELRRALPQIADPIPPWQRRRAVPGGAERGSEADLASAARHSYRLKGRLRRHEESWADERWADRVAAAEPAVAGSDAQRPGRGKMAAREGDARVSLVLLARPRELQHLPFVAQHVERQSRYGFAAFSVALEERAPATDLPVKLGPIITPDDADDSALQPYWAPAEPASPLGARARCELLAVARAPSDLVVVCDARMLLFASTGSWVTAALRKLRADRSLWLVAVHAGPPAGTPGDARSQVPNGGRARWDRRAQAWLARTPLSACFLLDRSKLYGKLRAPATAGAGLIECVGSAMQLARGQGAMLSGLSAWGVRAESSALEHGAWPARLAACIERGLFPPSQIGNQSVDLDDERGEWQQLLAGAVPQSDAAE